jgi:hypothetical protein
LRISNRSFPRSIETDDNLAVPNEELSINWVVRGITIERSEQSENALDSIRVNREFDSNETDKSDVHEEKHSEQRIWQLRGIAID